MKRSTLAVGTLTIALIGIGGPVAGFAEAGPQPQGGPHTVTATSRLVTTHAVLTDQDGTDTSPPTDHLLQTPPGNAQLTAHFHPMPGRPPSDPPGTLLPWLDSLSVAYLLQTLDT